MKANHGKKDCAAPSRHRHGRPMLLRIHQTAAYQTLYLEGFGHKAQAAAAQHTPQKHVTAAERTGCLRSCTWLCTVTNDMRWRTCAVTHAACIGAKKSRDAATACASGGRCAGARVIICWTNDAKSDAAVACTSASLASGLRSRDLTRSGG